MEDEVLADSETEQDIGTGPPRQRPLRRVRRGSPEAKHSRQKQKPVEELDIVNRQPDGNYLLGATGFSEPAGALVMSPEMEEEAERASTDAAHMEC